MVVSVRMARSSLWYCLTFACLYLHVQAGGDSGGQHPGAEPARGRVAPAGPDLSAEDQPNLLGAAEVEVVADHLLGVGEVAGELWVE
jgi:hypothetical protein